MSGLFFVAGQDDRDAQPIQRLSRGEGLERLGHVPGDLGERPLPAALGDRRERAEAGAGWVQYTMPHPQSGKPQEKMSYVVKVDGLYVGCGVYKSSMMEI